MKGHHAFCPKSGAPLSEDVHYDEIGRSLRHAVADDQPTQTQSDGELTNGALRSSKVAVFNYFRRSHQRHHEEDARLYTKAAVALSRLKRTASGKSEWDMYVWYALGERLARRGFDVKWMNVHIEPRCPECAGKLKFQQFSAEGVTAFCGTNCADDNADRLAEIRETVVDLYCTAFVVEGPDVPTVDDLELL